MVKRILSFGVCLVLMGVQFVSAAGKQDSGALGKVKTVKVWTNNSHSKPEMEAAIEKYNKGEGAQRGIFIDYQVYGAEYYTALDLAIAAGEEPHIYKISGKLPQLVQMGVIIPLTDLPDWFKNSMLKDYQPYHISGQSIFSGVPYTINWAIASYGSLAYNVSLLNQAGFTEPPKTWAEFERMCIAVSKINPGKVFGTYLPLKYPNYADYYVGGLMAPSYGGFFFDYTKGQYHFSDFAEYFEMYQRLRNAGAMFPGMESLDDDTARAQFSEGNIGFVLIMPSFNVGVFYDQFPAKIEWKIAPVPFKDPSKTYNLMGTTASNMVISKKVKDEKLIEEVARVYTYLMSDEVVGTLYTNGKDLPINPRVVQKAQPSNRSQWNDIAALATAGTVIRPSFPHVLYTVEGDDINTSFGKILTGGNIRQILADMDQRFNAGLNRALSQGVLKREDIIMPEIEQQFRKK